MTSRSYCFTHYGDLQNTFNEENVRYVTAQQEVCPKTNKIHWQGYAEFTKPIRRRAAIKYLNIQGAHLETRRGTRQEARQYCEKETSRSAEGLVVVWGTWIAGQGCRTDIEELATRVESGESDYELGPENIFKYAKFIKNWRSIAQQKKGKEYLQNNFKEVTLNAAQQNMIQHIDEQNDRQITWVCDPIGGAGKTFLSKHLIASRSAVRFTNGKNKDIAYAYNYEKLVIIDLSRSAEGFINYGIMEDLKNGMIFSTKYESSTKVFEPPKIIVMANFYPDLQKFSQDRWDIIEI